MRDRGDDKVTGILKADEAPIEQVIDAWSQQQSIFSIEALIVRRVGAKACNGWQRNRTLFSPQVGAPKRPGRRQFSSPATALSGEN